MSRPVLLDLFGCSREELLRELEAERFGAAVPEYVNRMGGTRRQIAAAAQRGKGSK